MCIRFGCNPIFLQLKLSFLAQHLPKHTDTGYLVMVIPPTILAGSFFLKKNFAGFFFWKKYHSMHFERYFAFQNA